MGPLSGVKVLELAAMGPVPFCGMLLADMGADVLRIDRPGPADQDETFAPGLDLRGRNKRSASINLKRPEGREALLRLASKADVLLEGFRPGVVERLGIGPDACLARNRALVYGRATGWGREGPLAHTAGHDINYIALTGALDMIGPKDGAPVPPLNLVGDYGGGALYLAFGVTSALVEARGSSRGQVVDAAMIDGVTSLLTVFHAFRQGGALVPTRGSNGLDGGAPFYTTYKTRDQRYVAVGAIEPRFYAVLIDKLGLRPDDLPPQGDRARWQDIRDVFAARFATRTRDEWAEHFAGTDACVTPVLSLEEARCHPHMAARQTLIEIAGVEQPAVAPRLSRTPGGVRHPPTRRSEHTREALKAWGFGDEDLEAVKK